MKKIKLSLLVVLAIIGASVTAFTGNNTIRTNTWYGQTTDAVPPYSTAYPLTTTQLNSKCPQATQHICAVLLDMNGNLVDTRKSTHNFIP